jgi:predicted nuclease of predicted toxin-antitoxin system
MPDSLRFHLDESVTRRVADGLRRRGIDCTSSPEEGLLGISDDAQLAFAQSTGRVLITGDDDFLTIASETTDHPGIVYWLQDRHFGQLVRDLHAMSFEKGPEELRGRVIYIA